MDNKERIKDWIIEVMALMGEVDKDLIREGMEIFCDLVDSKTLPTETEIKIRVGDIDYFVSMTTWHEINDLMKLQRSEYSGASYKISAIRVLRAYIYSRYGRSAGLRDTKEAVENSRIFPAV